MKQKAQRLSSGENFPPDIVFQFCCVSGMTVTSPELIPFNHQRCFTRQGERFQLSFRKPVRMRANICDTPVCRLQTLNLFDDINLKAARTVGLSYSLK